MASGPQRLDDGAGAATAALYRAVLAGEQGAWDQLVARFANLVWSIVRSYGLAGEDAKDAFQTTWLRLVEHLDGVREPERLGAWLATTARRECLHVLRRTSRETITDEELSPPGADEPAPLWHGLLLAERDAALWDAFRALSEHCRRLLRILMADPAPSYAEIAGALGMRIGSIGPTRRRCLDDLGRRLAIAGIDPTALGS